MLLKVGNFAFGCGLLISSLTAEAQLVQGDIAPNWTVTDINGTTHELYSYLDQGYSVFFDISATWCGPCWSFHGSGTMNSLMANHGPAGMEGVNENTTDDLMVIFLEGDVGTTTAQLNGASPTQGNWVAGSLYPIADLTNNNILNAYGLTGFPNAWLICPNRIVQRYYAGYSPSSMNANVIYNAIGSCLMATEPNDPSILAYTGDLTSCEDLNLSVQLQNMGTDDLTSATIAVMNAGEELLNYEWSGTLATYAVAEIDLGSIYIEDAADIDFVITSDDDNSENNTLSQTLSPAPLVGVELNVRIRTDNYGSETYWRIVDEGGELIAQGGNQAVGTNGGAGGNAPNGQGAYGNNTVYNQIVNVTDPACLNFEIYDYFGDGLCCAYGPGFYEVKDVATDEIVFSGGEFSDMDVKKMIGEGSSVGVSDISNLAALNLFPNPTTGVLQIRFFLEASEPVQLYVYDLVGRVVDSKDFGNLGQGEFNFERDFSHLNSGVYMLSIYAGESVTTQRLILSN